MIPKLYSTGERAGRRKCRLYCKIPERKLDKRRKNVLPSIILVMDAATMTWESENPDPVMRRKICGAKIPTTTAKTTYTSESCVMSVLTKFLASLGSL